MPTLGVMNSTKYKLQANRVAWEYVKEFNSAQPPEDNTEPLSLPFYDIEVNYDYDNSEESNVVEVAYTLKEDFESSGYPKQFSVLLNFDTGEKTITEVNSSEE